MKRFFWLLVLVLFPAVAAEMASRRVRSSTGLRRKAMRRPAWRRCAGLRQIVVAENVEHPRELLFLPGPDS